MKHILLAAAAGLLLAGCTDEDYYSYNTYPTTPVVTQPVAYAPARTVVAPTVATTAYSYPYTSTWKGRPYIQSAYSRPMYYNPTTYEDTRGEWINGRYVTTYSAEPVAYTPNRYWDSYQQRWIYE